MKHDSVILFDGVCNLCNTAVQYIIKHDAKAIFKFASLQSEAGQKLLKYFNLGQDNFNSFVLIKNNQAYIKSTAALMVARQLKGFTKLLYGFIIVPGFIRNAVYNIIARRRYKWFGKREECMLPTASLQSKFLK